MIYICYVFSPTFTVSLLFVSDLRLTEFCLSTILCLEKPLQILQVYSGNEHFMECWYSLRTFKNIL